MTRRDMSKAQFRAACERYGLVPQGFMGYYRLGATWTCVSILNAAPTRRAQLAYLIRELRKAEERCSPATS